MVTCLLSLKIYINLRNKCGKHSPRFRPFAPHVDKFHATVLGPLNQLLVRVKSRANNIIINTNVVGAQLEMTLGANVVLLQDGLRHV